MSAPTILEGQQLCAHCGGSGQAMPDCETCEGKGWEPDPEDGGTMTCTECDNERCEKCDGDGVVQIPKEAGGAA